MLCCFFFHHWKIEFEIGSRMVTAKGSEHYEIVDELTKFVCLSKQVVHNLCRHLTITGIVILFCL